MADQPVLLVSPAVLTAYGPAIARAAANANLTLVELPEAGYLRRPDADATERRRLGRADRRELAAALGGIRRSLGVDAVAMLVLHREEVTGQAGRAWLQRLREAAQLAGLALPRATRIATGADISALRPSVTARPTPSR